jgi:hypothetical protein
MRSHSLTKRLRSLIVAFAALAIAAAGFSCAPAFAATGPELVTSTVGSFPSGGEPLKQAISDLIYSNPEEAADVANFMRSDAAGLSAAQKEALEQGLADGLNRLGVVGFFPALAFSPLLLGVGAGTAAAGGVALAVTAKKSCTPVSPNTTC